MKNETLEMWILSKMRLWNCEFCQKWDFEIVNFVKNEIFKMWIFFEKMCNFASMCGCRDYSCNSIANVSDTLEVNVFTRLDCFW